MVRKATGGWHRGVRSKPHRDLIPDFVPVLGYLDDLILIPVGIRLAIRLVPDSVLADCRAWAQETFANGRPVSRVAGAVIVGVWITLATLCIVWRSWCGLEILHLLSG
jgi:uncharacterized membrane protein YedE/YeeE